MTIELDEAWPESLPLPLLEFTGQEANSTLASRPKFIALLQRSRFTRTTPTVAVSWTLTAAQYATLKAFFAEDLGNGAAQFSISLRYPLNSELTGWAVLFAGGLQAVHEEGLWQVQSALHLVNQLEL